MQYLTSSVNTIEFFLSQPRFIVLGGHKCGTTSLHHYLAQHPQILMPRTKGLDLLNKSNVIIENYQNLYDMNPDKKVFGEVSSTYLQSDKACQSIKKYFPNAKLIGILRNPIERAISNLNVTDIGKSNQITSISLLEKNNILNNGLYSNHIQKYYDNFDINQMRFFLFDDFINGENKFFRSFFDFVGVDSDFVPDTSIIFRKGGDKTNLGIIKNLLSNPILKFLIKPFTTPDQRRLITIKIKNIFTRKLDTNPELRQQIKDFYREDILKTEKLISRDLSHWLI